MSQKRGNRAPRKIAKRSVPCNEAIVEDTLAAHVANLPKDLTTRIMCITLKERPELMLQKFKRVLTASHGHVSSPLRHIDWVPGMQGLNIFYVPPEFYTKFPSEAVCLLHYLTRTCVMGLVLHRPTLQDCLNRWMVMGTALPKFMRFLGRFLPPTTWIQYAEESHAREFLFCTFASCEKMVLNGNGFTIREKHSVRIDRDVSYNPMIPLHNHVDAWRTVKLILAVRNNFTWSHTLTRLLKSENYHEDGRVREDKGIFTYKQLEEDYEDRGRFCYDQVRKMKRKGLGLE